MSGITFTKKTDKLSELEICDGFINHSPRILSRFYREQRIPFEGTIKKVFENDAIGLNTMDDVYHESFMRLYDLFQRKLFQVENGKILYKQNPLSGTIGNFLQNIGKNVFMEIKRKEDAEQKKRNGVQVSTGCGTTDREKEINAILVWKIVDEMSEPCNAILSATLTKHLTGKKDADIAADLNYKNVDTVKTNRTRCMKKFEKAFFALKNKYIS